MSINPKHLPPHTSLEVVGFPSPEAVAAELVAGHLAPEHLHDLFDPIEGLMAKFDQHFWCVQGPPRAYFEVPSDGSIPPVRVVYQTFAFAAQDDTAENRISLADTMWTVVFQPVVDKLLQEDPKRLREDTLLFWRKMPYFAPLVGATSEVPRPIGVGLRLRLAVPGVKIAGEFSGSY